MKTFRLIFASCALLAAAPAWADVTLPAILSEHAVLQKSGKTRFWGKADPGEAVAVTLDAATAKTVAGADGKWAVQLDLSRSKPGPFELIVQGKNRIAVADVVVGEVWIASGQSNMEFKLTSTLGAKEEITASANPLLRQFQVKKTISAQPLDQCQGEWTVAGPQTSGAFTAVGYHFGKRLQNELGLPVGLINSSWGGTPVEAWTSSEAIDAVPELKAFRESTEKTYNEYPAAYEDYLNRMGRWLADNGRELTPNADASAFAAPGISPEGWAAVSIPLKQKETQLPETGIVWLRKEIDIAKGEAKAPLRINLAAQPGFETVYWDGSAVSSVGYRDIKGSNAFHMSEIPPKQTTEGKHTLAIRLHNPLSWWGINPALRLGQREITGEWLAKAETAYPALTAEQRAAIPVLPRGRTSDQCLPTTLYGGMIAPLVPYTIRGAVWYQGEANAGRAWQYRTAFPAMIRDWRQRWGLGDFPFYFCQLCTYEVKRSAPGESSLSELREAQTRTLELPNTGQAVLIDLGEVDIHPRNKKDVGARLAAIALARDYGKAIPYQSPLYDSMSVEGGKVRLRFRHAEGGLAARPLPATYTIRSGDNKTAPLVRNSPNSELEGFAVCGEEKKWVWADAKADGETVLVWSDKIANPVAVRYAWDANPTCNLYNQAGFPASPFRTDDFPASTLNAR